MVQKSHTVPFQVSESIEEECLDFEFISCRRFRKTTIKRGNKEKKRKRMIE